ncbi:EamA-like transporter family [Striga hermonthica]|uniref:EamA-like transporter family n=1 Tax=Striga hermonthica TaxID=68872 RepID=A0A9N7N9M5_STRHE|nr:EamA-like transporter family [Striga hermonthica]
MAQNSLTGMDANFALQMECAYLAKELHGGSTFGKFKIAAYPTISALPTAISSDSNGVLAAWSVVSPLQLEQNRPALFKANWSTRTRLPGFQPDDNKRPEKPAIGSPNSNFPQLFLLTSTLQLGEREIESVVDEGVSPFLVTYICNSLFIVYIPLVELGRFLEDKYGSLLFWRNTKDASLQESRALEKEILLGNGEASANSDVLNLDVIGAEENGDNDAHGGGVVGPHLVVENGGGCSGLDAKGRWTRRRTAKVSLLISPMWFFAQLTFNLSLKYTTVTVRI